MSGPLLPATSPQSHSLSEVASTLVSRVSGLLRRLRNLEDEEVKLDVQVHQLAGKLSEMKDKPPMQCHHPNVSTPVLKRHVRAQGDEGTQNTAHADPRNIETPVKTFLLMESFALAMSVKSKRKGRIFLAGDSTEFGELQW